MHLSGPTRLLTGLGTCFLVLLVGNVQANGGWGDAAEMEMYDLIEELGKNFYDFLEIPADASAHDIRQAFRALSKKLHPDKNPDNPDAVTQFRHLRGVYDVLKDSELRETYDRVLVEGLPNWRQPMFYYRRYKKLELWQVAIIVVLIISLGQYLAGWAAYWERSLSIKEKVEIHRRRTQRTRKAQKEGLSQEELETEIIGQLLTKPSMWNLLPFQTLIFIKYMVVKFPFEVYALFQSWKAEKEERERQLKEDEAEAERNRQIAAEPKKPKKKKTFAVPEKTKEELEAAQANWGGDRQETQNTQRSAPVITGGLWTDEDISELVKLCSKFPGGTPARWETIASFLNRPVPEVTLMAKRVLERLSKKPSEEEEDRQPQLKLKVKTKGGKGDVVDRLKVENWSAEEQSSLEIALKQYSKGVSERWEKISSMVPGRSKEECMQRYKYLADLIKKSREQKEEEPAEAPEEPSKTVEVTPPEVSGKASDTPEEELPEPESPKKNTKKGRRQRRRERVSSSSSSGASDQDWCLVDDPSAH